MNLRPVFVLVYDVSVAVAAFYLTMILRYNQDVKALPDIVLPLLSLALLSAAGEFIFQFHKRIWRYISSYDLIVLIQMVLLTYGSFLLVMFVYNRLEGIPRSVILFVPLLHIALLSVPRIIARMLDRKSEFSIFLKNKKRSKINALVVGINVDSEHFIRDLVTGVSGAYNIVGILDKNEKHRGRLIHGVKVYGHPSQLSLVIEKCRKRRSPIQKIILAPDHLDHEALKAMMLEAEANSLTFGRLRRVTDVQSQLNEERDYVKPVPLEDLLGRTQRPLDLPRMEKLIHGKAVLITGAGGSIGSETVRQVAALHPSKVILLEVSEHALYQIDREIGSLWPTLDKHAILADVRDYGRLDRIFQTYQPELVFHAAAIKHVPLAELNPGEAVLTNVMGTQNLAQVCHAHGVKQMVYISTDKAVEPSNAMGASKRVAERLIQKLAEGWRGDKRAPLLTTIRFGNVLGSTGSVVPLFQEQIAGGGPVTVTDPAMERYFMTIREAMALVIQAAAIAEDHAPSGAPLFILDMGAPIKITDMAEQLIRLAGKQPHTDIKIIYTGVREGEKLTEELAYDFEVMEATVCADVRRVVSGKPSGLELQEAEALVQLAKDGELQKLQQKLMKLAQ